MTRRLKEDPPPKLTDVAPHIEHRMANKSGSVTLHFLRGRLETVQWGDREDSRCLVPEREE
jgi:hypothetical protein